MKLSFGQELKDELTIINSSCEFCNRALLYGMMLFSKSLFKENFCLVTENESIALLYRDLLYKECRIKFIMEYRNSKIGKKQRQHIHCLCNKTYYENILKLFNQYDAFINKDIIINSCCMAHFIRGAFLVCGSIVDPNKAYHLEYVIPYYELYIDFLSIMQQIGIDFKYIKRRNKHILYLKDSNHIEDMLTFIGASKFSLEIMNIKILKNVRNKINRVVNCETANLDKTINTSSSQIKDIEYIISTKGENFLNNDLRQIAVIRYNNPDMSLQDIYKYMSCKISKSTIYRRLKKISQIANELRNQNG